MKTLTGHERFVYDDKDQDFDVEQFWAWSSSDLLNNTLRGALAEFIVASACGIDTSIARADWDAYDLKYRDVRIEVKCSAYLQSWEQKKESAIRFSIAPAKEWSVEKGYIGESIRRSDIYVFCVFACSDRARANPLNLSQWEFYILPTAVIDEKCGAQKTIGLESLRSLNSIKCSFGEIKGHIENVAKKQCA